MTKWSSKTTMLTFSLKKKWLEGGSIFVLILFIYSFFQLRKLKVSPNHFNLNIVSNHYDNHRCNWNHWFESWRLSCEERVDIQHSPENRDVWTLSRCTVRSSQILVLFNHWFYKLFIICFCFNLNLSEHEKRTAFFIVWMLNSHDSWSWS